MIVLTVLASNRRQLFHGEGARRRRKRPERVSGTGSGGILRGAETEVGRVVGSNDSHTKASGGEVGYGVAGELAVKERGDETNVKPCQTAVREGGKEWWGRHPWKGGFKYPLGSSARSEMAC